MEWHTWNIKIIYELINVGGLRYSFLNKILFQYMNKIFCPLISHNTDSLFGLEKFVENGSI